MSSSPAAASPSFRLAALLTTLVALGPLSTDLYLPSLPTLAAVFSTDAARVQLTLSVFLAGFAVGQLVYGALSDRFGRRPVMLGGLALYLLASVACLFAQSISMLIAARFVQALGACAGPVLGRAIVRDVWGPVEAVRVLAYVSGSMALAPLVGPTLGGFLTVWFGWQSNFVLLALFSALQIAAVWYWLGESNQHLDRSATQPGRIIKNFAILLVDRNYLGYLLALSFSYSALFAFISGSSFVLSTRFGLSPQVFGMCFGLVVAGYVSGSMLSGRLVRRYGGDHLLHVGGWIGAFAGAVMWGLERAGVHHLVAVLAPMFFVTLSIGLVMSNAVGRALAPYPKMAGAASSLMGFCQMSMAALVGTLVGHGVDSGATVLSMTVALCSMLVPLSYLALVRHNEP